MKISDSVVLFWRGSDFLSNFFPSLIKKDDKIFHCAEAAFQFDKAMFFWDFASAEKILNTTSPSVAKQLGREVSQFDEEKWGAVREERMYHILKCKFGQDSALAEKLLNTGERVLGEASPYDTLWGIGWGEDDDRSMDPEKWRGRNKLGELLMKLRDEIRKQE